MLDQLRRDMQSRLNELLGEAEKLRRALAALSSRSSTPSPPAASPRARDSATARSRPQTPKPTRARRTAAGARARSAGAPAAKPPRGSTATTPRTAPGATKTAVLTALADGQALTAAQVATTTGLGRPTVSTTLSRLAKAGDVTKAARGYQIAAQASNGGSASAARNANE